MVRGDLTRNIKRYVDIETLLKNEVGVVFNHAKKARCPMHDDKTASLQLNDDNTVHCYGACDGTRDALAVIKILKGLDTKNGVLYLENNYGLPPLNNKSYGEGTTTMMTTTTNYKQRIQNKIENQGGVFIDAYQYDNQGGEAQWFNVKYSNKVTGLKSYMACHFVDGVLKMGRGENTHGVYPYNFSECKAQRNRVILICEGEKDVETLKDLKLERRSNNEDDKISVMSFSHCCFDMDTFDNPETPSMKEVCKFLEGKEVYFLSDTGEAGEKYKEKCFAMLKNRVKTFFDLAYNLADYMAMPDNSDITDWLNLEWQERQNRIVVLLKSINNASFDWKKNDLFTALKPNGTVKRISENIESYVHRRRITAITDVSNGATSKYCDNIKNNFSSKRFLWRLQADLSRDSGGVTFPLSEIESVLQDKLRGDKKKNSFLSMCQRHANGEFNSMIDSLISRFVFAENTDHSLNRLKFEKFFLGVITQSHNDIEGHDVQDIDFTLILKGGQNCGKSTLVQQLMMHNYKDREVTKGWYSTGASINFEDNSGKRDTVTNSKRTTLVEFAETIKDIAKDNGANNLKAFFQSEANVVYKFENEGSTHISNSSFIFTTNDSHFLRDFTGNRRFGVLDVLSINPLRKMGTKNGRREWGEYDFDIKKFWGAVYQRWLESGNKCHTLSQDEALAITEDNKKYLCLGNVAREVEAMFDWSDEGKKKIQYLTKTELWSNIEIYSKGRIFCSKDRTQVEAFLAMKGIQYQAKKIDKETRVRYFLPSFSSEFLEALDSLSLEEMKVKARRTQVEKTSDEKFQYLQEERVTKPIEATKPPVEAPKQAEPNVRWKVGEQYAVPNPPIKPQPEETKKPMEFPPVIIKEGVVNHATEKIEIYKANPDLYDAQDNRFRRPEMHAVIKDINDRPIAMINLRGERIAITEVWEHFYVLSSGKIFIVPSMTISDSNLVISHRKKHGTRLF